MLKWLTTVLPREAVAFTSPSVPPVPQSHPQLCSRPVATTPTPISTRSFPPNFHPLTHCFIPAPNSNKHSLGILRKFQPGKHDANYRSSSLPPLIKAQSPRLIRSSIADNLLMSLLTLWPHSQATKQILVKHTAFLSPMYPPSHPIPTQLLSIHIPKSQLLTPRNILYPESPMATTSYDPGRIFYQATHNHHTILRTRKCHRNQGSK